jgi:hypothetical protein
MPILNRTSLVLPVAARWIDDRIIDFVRIYLRLHEGD